MVLVKRNPVMKHRLENSLFSWKTQALEMHRAKKKRVKKALEVASMTEFLVSKEDDCLLAEKGKMKAGSEEYCD